MEGGGIGREGGGEERVQGREAVEGVGCVVEGVERLCRWRRGGRHCVGLACRGAVVSVG